MKKGECTCGKSKKYHEKYGVTSIHHYWYMHNGYVKDCVYCDNLKQLNKAVK